MIAQYFQNGTVRLVKETIKYHRTPVFRVWVFVNNMWVFEKRVCAQSFDQAYEVYVNEGGVV